MWRAWVRRIDIRKGVFSILIAGAPLALAACAPSHPAAPTALQAPAVNSHVDYYMGTPLSGPLAKEIGAVAPADALVAKVTFIGLQAMPRGVFDPLGAQVRLIAATRAGSPVLPSGRLTQGTRFTAIAKAETFKADLAAGKFGPSISIATLDGALPGGATAVFALEDTAGSPDVIPEDIARKSVRVELYRPDDKTSPLQAALVVEDFVDVESPIDEAAESSTVGKNPPVFQREVAVFNRPGNRDPFALIIPIQFKDAQTAAVVAIVEISPSSADAAHQKALTEAIAELKTASQAAGKRPDVVSVDPPDWPGLSSALESLFWVDRQRAGLVFLAGQTQAVITEDVALAADETVLSKLADGVSKAMIASPAARDRASIGWVLERTTLGLLLQMQSSGKMPAEMSAILAMQAGEAGRHSSTLEEVMTGVTGRQDLENRLAAENYIFLEDTSPASRVRAYDWLRSRGLAPAGFDPLGTSKARRTALDKAQQSAANPGTLPS
jgi:hypothetical protein